jgi:hypothetical protein
MVNIDITLNLPTDLAREAEAQGLLTPEALQRLIDAEVTRRRSVEQLFKTMDQLAEIDLPPLSNDELNAEIKAARAERRSRRAGGA